MTEKQHQKEQLTSVTLCAARLPIKLAAAVDGTADLRHFEGVAYTGQVIPDHYYWGDLVFDLSGIVAPERWPVLVNHDVNQRAGFVTQHSVGQDGLTVRGTLLSNTFGKTVSRESDDGFPWQMSLQLTPKRVYQLSSKEKGVVNGKELIGPLTIFAESEIGEVSFVPMGADSHTSAVALSSQSILAKEEVIYMDVQAENASLKAQLAELKAAHDAAQQAAIDAKLATMFGPGAPLQPPEKEVLDVLRTCNQAQATAFAKVIESATAQRQKLPEQLFQHVATAGRAQAEEQRVSPLLLDAQARASAVKG